MNPLFLKKIFRKNVFILYLIFLLVVPFSAAFFNKSQNLFLISIIFLTAYIVIVEILFRFVYKLYKKHPYQLIPKVPFKKIYIEPHPYLPYVYKKKFLCQKAMPADYPLHRNEGYMFAELTTNNFRHLNGPNGDRDVITPKPKGLIRINCLGGSTTGNYIRLGEENYSYPMELEKTLKKSFPELEIEVNNLGQGGYTTAEMLIKFLLDTIDTEPDVVVMYHAYNDLGPSLTDRFEADYSHARRGLGEVYHLYKWASRIPYIPLASWNYFINNFIFSQNIRFSLLSAIARNRPNIENQFQGLKTYKRNIGHLINICKNNGIKVVLSTYCYYLYPRVAQDKMYIKYFEGVKSENEVMRELASEHNLPLVENDRLIPPEEKYFVDTVHFTPEGMRLVAKNISAPIVDYIKVLVEESHKMHSRFAKR